MVWSVCLLSCRLGFDFESGQINDFKIGIHNFPAWRSSSIKGTVWRTSRQVYLLCRRERHLAGFPHLGVVARWLATPKRARIALWSLSRVRRINMQQQKKTLLAAWRIGLERRFYNDHDRKVNGSTHNLFSLLRPWIRCFTMIISAWWNLASSKLKK